MNDVFIYLKFRAIVKEETEIFHALADTLNDYNSLS